MSDAERRRRAAERSRRRRSTTGPTLVLVPSAPAAGRYCCDVCGRVIPNGCPGSVCYGTFTRPHPMHRMFPLEAPQ